MLQRFLSALPARTEIGDLVLTTVRRSYSPLTALLANVALDIEKEKVLPGESGVASRHTSRECAQQLRVIRDAFGTLALTTFGKSDRKADLISDLMRRGSRTLVFLSTKETDHERQ